LDLVRLLAFGIWCLLVGAGCESASPKKKTPPPEGYSTNALVQSCLLCHGTREMQRGPIIDGLPAWYLEDQLTQFLTGVRGRNSSNKSEFLMGSGVTLLKSDADVETVVEYFSQLPPANHLKTIRGDATRGQQLYTLCATCHGPYGEGREDIKSPPLFDTSPYLYNYKQFITLRMT
jgi:cytochrome c553